MDKQESLFEFSNHDGHKTASVKSLTRKEHPDTSRVAAASLVSSGNLGAHEIVALELVRLFPGSTAGELDNIARRKYGYQNREVSKRLSGLAAKYGKVKRGEARKCNIKGSQMMTWWPVGGEK